MKVFLFIFACYPATPCYKGLVWTNLIKLACILTGLWGILINCSSWYIIFHQSINQSKEIGSNLSRFQGHPEKCILVNFLLFPTWSSLEAWFGVHNFKLENSRSIFKLVEQLTQAHSSFNILEHNLLFILARWVFRRGGGR